MAIRLFDLNIEEVLENWEVHHGVRELISNALDEQRLSHTAEPKIEKGTDGWHIRDFGRGLRIEHFTQNENPEKVSGASGVIGKFGVGLKDALATLYRHGITVTIHSNWGTYRLKTSAKVGFQGIQTLHIEYDDTPRPIDGTDVLLAGVTDEDMAAAKSLFLTFSQQNPVEVTQYGEVLDNGAGLARVYISGVYANDEPNFLFSYNITSLTGAMRKKLNRERLNVGRSTYTERIVAILKQATSSAVTERLADQALKTKGEQCDEMQWAEIGQLAFNALSARRQVSFVTETQWQQHPDVVDNMRRDGYQVVVVGDAQQNRLEQQVVEGGPLVRTLDVYVGEYNQSFQYMFVEEGELSRQEREIFKLTPKLFELVQVKNPPKVRVSETLRADLYDTRGVWDVTSGCIVIKRSALSSATEYAGVLLHEVAHATTGALDATRNFENVLTDYLGSTGSRAV
jgi:hypothetical protein